MSTGDDLNSIRGFSANRQGFGTFPRTSSGPKPARPIRKPAIPPKPKATLKPRGRQMIILAKKEIGNYFEALPVKMLEAMEIENQHHYDSAVPVCLGNLETNEDYGYEIIGDHRIYNSSDNIALDDGSEEPIYNEASIQKPILKMRSRKRKEEEEEEEEKGDEECHSDDDNHDADFYVLQKYKNRSRASWVKKVESMNKKDGVQVKKRNLERLISKQWNSQDDDDDVDELDVTVSTKETMDLRLVTINEIMKDEKSYADKLKKMIENSGLVSSCGPHVKRDLEPILEIVANLLYLHKTFSNDLQKALAGGEQYVGGIIERFVEEEFIQAKEYTAKYRSITTMQVLSPATEVFNQKKKDELFEVNESKLSEDSRQECLQSFLTSLSLPIWRFQMCIHYLKRIIKYTAHSHPDYDHLQRALHRAKSFFSDLSTSSSQDVPLRHLVKKGLVVVQVENERKLRHLFLFNDVVICAKQRMNNKLTVQWFLPLHLLTVDDRQSAQEDQCKAMKDKTDSLKRSLIKYQAEYSREFKKTCFSDKNKKLEIIKKKLMELETELILNTPYLRLVLNSTFQRRPITILLSSDYERAAWKNSLSSFISKARPNDCKINLSQANILINDLKLSPFISHDDVFQSTRIDGLLKLTIHKFLGLQNPAKIFCTVEVDSFGHFFLKAKTTRINHLEPEWNEDFDIELEGANTLRVMCYQAGQESDIHLGSIALELNEAWLKEKFCEENVPISTNMFLKISIEYTSPSDFLNSFAKTSMKNGHYFGVHLEKIARLENNNIPLIIRNCIEEIEKRGMKDTGIYRVSGLSSEIQKLKMSFNRDSTSASTSIRGVDTNVLTGIIKLFLRELPEPLFPSSKYHEFIKCLLHPSTLEDNLKQQMARLPSPNYETIVFLLQHLVRVAGQEAHNKMTLGNLATIFGPNLMKNPSPTKNSCHDLVLSNTTADITHQCKVILRLLTMVAQGCAFTRDR